MTIKSNDQFFLEKAITLSRTGMQEGKGGPFGCVIVKEGVVIGEGYNQVTSSNDPTAHAEVVAIRQACRHLNSFQLNECDVFCSCEPCPMCLGAIYWSRPNRVVFANTRSQAAAIAFDDDYIYREIESSPAQRNIPFIHLAHPEAEKVFQEWLNFPKKIYY